METAEKRLISATLGRKAKALPRSMQSSMGALNQLLQKNTGVEGNGFSNKTRGVWLSSDSIFE